MNRCTRCKKTIQGQVYDMTPRPRPSFFAKGTDFDELVKPTEWVFSCADCLTDDEVAKLCAPVAQFVVERMLRHAADPKAAADGTAEARAINAENVKTLMRVRTRLRYEDDTGRSEKDLAARARKALHGDRRPFEASELFRQVKQSDNHIVRQAASMIEWGTPPEEALTRVLFALAKSYDRAVEELIELRSRMPFTIVVDESVPANEIRVREREPRAGFITLDDAAGARAMNRRLNELMFGEMLVGLEARYIEWVNAADNRHNPTPPKCVHCQRPSTELSYSLCPECIPCHSWFDGAGYVFEDVPNKNCAHLNRAQRRFICDVGTRAAYDDGGARLAELADTQGPYILYQDERVVVGTYSDPETLSPGMQAAAGAILEAMTEGSWVCTNHPEGLEITYPAATQACEVCGRMKP